MLEKLRKAFLGQKGFTLVEVIVVSVIVAILAAVAVPLYRQYVQNSKQNAVDHAAGSLASFCAAARANDVTVVVPAAGWNTGTGLLKYTAGANTDWIIPKGLDTEVTGNAAGGGTCQVRNNADNLIISALLTY